MLPANKYRWFYRIVRSNTKRIDEETAAKYKFKLASVYALSGIFLYAFGRYYRDKDLSEKKKRYGESDEYPYWLQATNVKNAVVYKIKGFSEIKKDVYDVEKLREQELAKGEQLIIEE